ncbi:NUDIX hydrolase [Pseudonocardia acidicola]|uniref:NUDIX hydrolase n=1 Tax=Pseudonocardia acidicola TaxID=2724939 RepID=UPI001B7CF83F|nr:NUDIX hydrolase [Pseudonocardia acidicola]
MIVAVWVVLVTLLLIVTWVTVLCVGRARRLDRLHVRTDAARAGLDMALARRAEVAGQVAAALARTGQDVTALRAAVGAAGAVAAAEREGVENALSRQLAAVDRGRLDAALLEELVDAEQLVILARRVHNDAVRDTLGLRSRRLVRWLRLAGTAPEPGYFEIADPEPGSMPIHRSAPERSPDPTPH